MDFGEKPKKRVTINITSLVDILIVLLLFFMLTTQFVHMEIINLSLAGNSGDTETKTSNNKTITVTLIGESKFSLNGDEFNLLELKDKIKPLLDKTADIDIIIVSKKEAMVQDVVTAIDYIKSIGGKNISLAEDSQHAGK